MKLVIPSEEYLPGYVAALEGDHKNEWLPAEYKEAVLQQIRKDPRAFLASRNDPDGIRNPELERPITPYVEHWMWDGEFCGLIGVRWQPGTNDLPAPYTSNVGYETVPWKQGKGYATEALSHILPIAKNLTGLDHVVGMTTPDNVTSQKVIGRVIKSINGEKGLAEEVKPVGKRKMPDGTSWHIYHIPLPELGTQSTPQPEQHSTTETPMRRLGSPVRRDTDNASIRRGPR